jgi:hypothetical protein
MTVVDTRNKARTMDFQAGDVGYVENTLLHYIENTGDTDLIFLEMFKSRFYRDMSLSEWLTHTPPELVMAHLNIDRATLDAIPRDKLVVVPGGFAARNWRPLCLCKFSCEFSTRGCLRRRASHLRHIGIRAMRDCRSILRKTIGDIPFRAPS